MNIFQIDCRLGFSIFQDALTNANTKLVAPCTSLVSWDMHCVIFITLQSWLSMCNNVLLFPVWMWISEVLIGSPRTALQNASTVCQILAPSSICQIGLTQVMMKQYFTFFCTTMMWAFLAGPVWAWIDPAGPSLLYSPFQWVWLSLLGGIQDSARHCDDTLIWCSKLAQPS